jgi:ATP/maltotriose-dependent transcriptional regulator MalT
MDLLEREPILAELGGLLRDAAGGAGRIAAISGEAGAGKTSLVEHFITTHGGSARTLRGLCDPLSTPRPLGPVHDMAGQTNGPLAAALRDAVGREGLFSAFLAELGRPPVPCMVVVEDVHWADDATMDLLRFVGRRIPRLPALLLITYRDDEIDSDHHLHHLLGELPQNAVRWLHLPLLSEAAVREMARRSGRETEGVYARTGGNPFFVTEVLASSHAMVPTSIREAVLARGSRLSAGARELVDVAAVVPGRVERRLLETLFDGAPALIRECAASGVLVAVADSVGFRHELARMAWQDTLEPGADARLHARILRALLDRGEGGRELARIVHHADGAGDGERVLHFAPAAAREAAAVGAHRQAAAHYATALRHAGELPPAPRAALLESFSYERHLVGGIADAVRARQEALALRRVLDDRRGEGADLRWLSRLAWFEGRHDAAVALGEEAIAVLEPVGPTPELAMAYSNLAQLYMLADDAPGATSWGERAIALAEQLGDVETLVHALNNVGSAELVTPRKDAGLRRVERSIDLALRHGFHEHAVRAYTSVACFDVRLRDYPRAAVSIDRTLRFAAEHEIEAFELYILGWRARLALERGDWEAAERDAVAVIGRYHTLTVVRFQSLIVLALLRERRGEGDAGALLDEAMSFALPTAELQRIGPAVTARAEMAWLRGDSEAARPDLEAAWEITRRSHDRWGRAQLAWWLWRIGALAAPPDDAPDPLRLQFQGDWRGAAAAWERIGAPYERALALANGDTPDAWHDALAGLEALGAQAAAAAVRRDLRRRGARAVPRGPRQTTRRNPGGLTPGQVRVLALLVRGLSNGDIARELFLSPRTVDHHVSAILAKLEVTTRAAAIAAAHDRQLLQQR